MTQAAPHARHTVQLYHCADFKVVNGYNLGAPVSFASELTLDDAYQLNRWAKPVSITADMESERHFRISKDSAAGTAGNRLIFDCVMTMMGTLGDTVEVIVLVETDSRSCVEACYILPLAPLSSTRAYILIGVDRNDPQVRFGEVAFSSFGRGTRILLGDGTQKPVQDIKEGDLVQTRDDGARPLRWIGQSTVRAVGDFAPVCIRAGAMNNLNDLRLSSDCRVLIYQREDRLKLGRAEALVKARTLVNGRTIYRDDGGFVDYYQLLFDDHQIIYADGIAVETLQLTDRTVYGLPKDVSDALGLHAHRHRPRPHSQFSVGIDALSEKELSTLLKQDQHP